MSQRQIAQSPATGRPARIAAQARRGGLIAALLLLASCESAYYGAWEKVGVHKRDILVDRVEDAAEAQEEAKEEFVSALEKFSSVVNVPPSDLKDTYEELSEAFEDAESRAEKVSDRIDSVEDVSEDLFSEWEGEIEQISNSRLRSASADQLRKSRRQYDDLIKSMRRAESKMPPVLTAFQDQVLFLKHNLNAQAIASLEGELGMIETNVAALIRDMETSIARSQAFIEDMQLLGGET
jgi:DNA-directed RNA polymerase subunit F